jgi:type II restriction/modification system DNA methylase subunit YeeA
VLSIQKEINETDKEIDQMVYKLYNLTEDEIKIVEGV